MATAGFGKGPERIWKVGSGNHPGRNLPSIYRMWRFHMLQFTWQPVTFLLWNLFDAAISHHFQVAFLDDWIEDPQDEPNKVKSMLVKSGRDSILKLAGCSRIGKLLLKQFLTLLLEIAVMIRMIRTKKWLICWSSTYVTSLPTGESAQTPRIPSTTSMASTRMGCLGDQGLGGSMGLKDFWKLEMSIL